MRHRFLRWAALLCALVFAACGPSTAQTGGATTQATPTLRPAGTVSATISPLGLNDDYEIAADDTAVWVHDGLAATLLRIDPKTNAIVATIHLGDGRGGVALGLGAVWVVSSRAGLISRVDPQTNTVVATIPIEAEEEPLENIAVSANALWLTDFIDNTLIRIDPQTKQVVAKLPNNPGVGWVSFGAGSVWACNHHSDTQGLMRLDPLTNQVQAQINPAGDKGFCGGVVALAQSVWTISFLNDEPESVRVERIDPATNKVSATIPMPGILPGHLAADAQGVWAFDPAGTLYRIDPTTNRLVGSLALPGVPQGIGVGAGSVWVATNTGMLRITPAA